MFRFAVNYVVLALVVQPPWRPDRCFALPVLWRAFRKKGTAEHRKKTELARELAHLVALALPARRICLLGDSAYVNATVMRDRPGNLEVIGPLPLKAALYRMPGPAESGQRGRKRKKGERWPTPKRMLEMPEEFVADERAFALPSGDKVLRLQTLRGVLWYTGLQRGAGGRWCCCATRRGRGGTTALLSTDVGLGVDEVVLGYCRRWSIELAFHDAKQYLGMQDPQVWCEASVERAHPMGFFCLSLTMLWYAVNGDGHERPTRERPWYERDQRGALTEVLGTLRLALLRGRYFGEQGTPALRRHPRKSFSTC